jgi:uncharacterized protein YjiS (DUF1127 family)
MLSHMQASSRSSFLANRSFPTARAVHPPLSWLASIRSAITRMRSMIRERRARRRAIAELRALDDRSLRDIGLLRCEIDQIPRIGPWE